MLSIKNSVLLLLLLSCLSPQGQSVSVQQLQGTGDDQADLISQLMQALQGETDQSQQQAVATNADQTSATPEQTTQTDQDQASLAQSEQKTDAPSPDSGSNGNPLDRYSFANIHQVQTQHVHMALNVNFEKSIIEGVVEHKMKVGNLDQQQSGKPDAISQVILDVQGMDVKKVELIPNGGSSDKPSKDSFLQMEEESNVFQVKNETKKQQKIITKTTKKQESKEVKNQTKEVQTAKKAPAEKAPAEKVDNTVKSLSFQVGAMVPDIGQALTIQLPQQYVPGSLLTIKVYYTTNDQATAFSWLTPSQTLGKKMPYLFTQCQFLACRSVAPLQDTPAVKATYSADVTVPKEFNVKMSANDTGSVENGAMKTYKFLNQIKTPSYLIALAIGDIERKELGARVGVITEPNGLAAASKELESLETYLDEVEKYIGVPYAWGHYDILVLPPSFPFGGMENPLLTFISPTMITGDKSQIATAIHEVVHSWMGNLVTCKTWEDVWLNESPTVFIQSKITAKLYGQERAKVECLIDDFSLNTALTNLEDKPGLTKLHLDMAGSTPESAKSNVQYNKGAQLLFHLESLIGEENMRQFLGTYVKTFYEGSATSRDFINTFEIFIQDQAFKGQPDKLKEVTGKLDWQSWIYGSGKLPIDVDFSTPNSQKSQFLAQQYQELKGSGSPDDFEAFKDYDAKNKLIFLDKLRENYSQIDSTIMERIDNDYHFTDSLDPKVKQRWYWLGILQNYTPVFEKAHEFMKSQGKTENLQFIYRAMVDSGNKETAQKWLDENRNFYHKSAIAKVEAILNDA